MPNFRVSQRWLHRLALLTSASAFFLLFLGGLVTSHQAGLSVPDWPTSYGWNMFTFPMKDWIGGIFYEHTHRLFASYVGFLILLQAILLQKFETRKWVKQLGWLALGGVIVQGVLGGITVLTYLPPAISSSHAGLGQSVFCLTLAIALITSRKWNDTIVKRAERSQYGARFWSLTAVIVVFVQLILGSVMRHTFLASGGTAGLAIPTFPFAPNGSLIPDFTSFGVVINFAHRVWAGVVVIVLFITARTIYRFHAREKSLVVAMMLGMMLLGIQITLGAITVWSSKAVTPTTLHVSCGAAILGTMTYVMIKTRHLFAPKVQRRTEPVESVAPAISTT